MCLDPISLGSQGYKKMLQDVLCLKLVNFLYAVYGKCTQWAKTFLKAELVINGYLNMYL